MMSTLCSGTLHWDEILRYQRTRVARSLEVRDQFSLSTRFSSAFLQQEKRTCNEEPNQSAVFAMIRFRDFVPS